MKWGFAFATGLTTCAGMCRSVGAFRTNFKGPKGKAIRITISSGKTQPDKTAIRPTKTSFKFLSR